MYVYAFEPLNSHREWVKKNWKRTNKIVSPFIDNILIGVNKILKLPSPQRPAAMIAATPEERNNKCVKKVTKLSQKLIKSYTVTPWYNVSW